MGNPDHIHEAGDGRPSRRVTVNGKVIERVFFADTLNGVVKHYDYPLRVDPSTGEAAFSTMHGKVKVELI